MSSETLLQTRGNNWAFPPLGSRSPSLRLGSCGPALESRRPEWTDPSREVRFEAVTCLGENRKRRRAAGRREPSPQGLSTSKATITYGGEVTLRMRGTESQQGRDCVTDLGGHCPPFLSDPGLPSNNSAEQVEEAKPSFPRLNFSCPLPIFFWEKKSALLIQGLASFQQPCLTESEPCGLLRQEGFQERVLSSWNYTLCQDSSGGRVLRNSPQGPIARTVTCWVLATLRSWIGQHFCEVRACEIHGGAPNAITKRADH